MRWLILLALAAVMCLPVGVAAVLWVLGPWGWWEALGVPYGVAVVVGAFVWRAALRGAVPAQPRQSV